MGGQLDLSPKATEMKLSRIVLRITAFALVILGCVILLSSMYVYDDPWGTLISAWGWSFACLCVGFACFALYHFGSKLKRFKTLFKKLAIGLGILLVAFVLFLVEENIRGKIALRFFL